MTRRFEGVGGVTLVGERRGDPADPAVIFLHGGGQTRHSWGRTAAAVAERGWCAWTLDARGHGESDWAPDGDYRLASFAGDVVRVMGEIGGRPPIVGASLGGLTALMPMGSVAPGAASGLVLVDIVPKMETKGTDRIRTFMEDRMFDGFGSLEEVADAVAAYNPHRERPTDLEGLRKNLRERDGRFYWHWDPDFIRSQPDRGPAEVADHDTMMDHALAITEPMMLVRGRMSDVVSAEGAREFLEAVPTARFVDVGEAGHMVAGDRNDAFTDAVVAFLDGLGNRGDLDT